MKIEIILFLLLFIGVTDLIPAQEKKLTPDEIAWNRVTKAEQFYFESEFENCHTVVESCIQAIEKKSEYYPVKVQALFYRLKAYLLYAFREAGYEEAIRDCFMLAIELDPDLETHEPGMIPSYVFNCFRAVKNEYLSRFSRMQRRQTLGVFGALILDSAALINSLDYIQPGIHYSLNLTDILSLALDMRLPLQLFYNSGFSLRGQLGFLLFPAFRIEKLHMGISIYYLFNWDNIFTNQSFAQAVSFCNQSEIIFRNGLGFGANVEILRLDILGITDKTQTAPDYSSFYLIPGLLRTVIANISVFIFYTF